MNEENEDALEQFSKIQGKLREEYFKNGGTLAGWRGVHLVENDRKKERSRRGCRKWKHEE